MCIRDSLSRHVDNGDEVWNDGRETADRSDGVGVRLRVGMQKASTQMDLTRERAGVEKPEVGDGETELVERAHGDRGAGRILGTVHYCPAA